MTRRRDDATPVRPRLFASSTPDQPPPRRASHAWRAAGSSADDVQGIPLPQPASPGPTAGSIDVRAHASAAALRRLPTTTTASRHELDTVDERIEPSQQAPRPAGSRSDVPGARARGRDFDGARCRGWTRLRPSPRRQPSQPARSEDHRSRCGERDPLGAPARSVDRDPPQRRRQGRKGRRVVGLKIGASQLAAAVVEENERRATS